MDCETTFIHYFYSHVASRILATPGSPLAAGDVSRGPEMGQGTSYGLLDHFLFHNFHSHVISCGPPGSWPPPGSPQVAGGVGGGWETGQGTTF